MENTFLIFFVGIVIAMVIGALSSVLRSPNSPTNRDTTNKSDSFYFGADDTHHGHRHGHDDHTSSFFSSGDSGSCDSGDCGGGGCDGGGGGGCD